MKIFELKRNLDLARNRVLAANKELCNADLALAVAHDALQSALYAKMGLEPNQVLTMREPFYSRTKANNRGHELAAIGDRLLLIGIVLDDEGNIDFEVTNPKPEGLSVGGVTLDELEAMK